MADLSDVTAMPVADTFLPPTDPTGFVFDCGFCVTHDASAETLSTLVAPLLTGLTTSDTRQRVLGARAAGSSSELVVLAAGDRIDHKGPVIPWIHTAPIAGRRLHAKFGVLQFRNDRGTCHTRAYVTSANLTRKGLTSNHEMLCIDECGRSTRTHLVFDLLEAIKHLVSLDGTELRPDDVVALKRVRRRLRQGLASGGKPTGAVVHSLDRPRDLTRKWAQASRSRSTRSDGRELTIVSPAFAADSDRVAIDGLSKVLDNVQKLHLVTSPDEHGRAQFSRAAWQQLNDQVDNIRLSLPAPPVDASDTPRRLHSKLLAVTMPRSRALGLVGSANYTSKGLAGRNRELMLIISIPQEGLDEALRELELADSEEPVGTGTKEYSETVGDLGDSLTATFTLGNLSRPTQRRWEGHLQLNFDGDRPRSIRHDGQVLEITEEQVATIDSNRAYLEVTYADMSLVEVPITVEPPDGLDDGFWHVPTVDDVDDDEYVLHLLFGDLMRAVAADDHRRGQSDTGTDTGILRDDDRYSLALDQRLVRLARRQIRLGVGSGLPEGMLDAAIRNYLADDGPEAIEVGRALVGTLNEADDPPALLRALSEVSARAESGESS